MHLTLNGEEAEKALGGENLPDWCLDFPPSLIWKNTHLMKKLNGILMCQSFKVEFSELVSSWSLTLAVFSCCSYLLMSSDFDRQLGSQQIHA